MSASVGSKQAQVLFCMECGRQMRSAREKAADHPGTIVRGTRELCVTHYKAARAPSPSEGHRFSIGAVAAKDVVLATIPERFPQRSDCRPSCCRNPFMCRNSFRCACHGGV